MPIYDNDGTTSYQIGKVYDNDGSASHQIGKVYDNNGTASSLIYSGDVNYYNYGWGDATSAALKSVDGLVSFSTAPKTHTDGSLYYELVGTDTKTSDAVVYLKPALSLSGFKTLHYNLYVGTTCYYGASNYVNCGLGTSANSFSKRSGNVTFSGDNRDWRWVTLSGTLDISSLNGNFYFQIFHRVYTWGGGTMKHAAYLRFAYCD